MTPTEDANGDHVCEHGTAMDVHCCHCHSGFIFDKDHECQEDQTMLLRTSTGVMLTVERYNDLLEGERGMWKTLKQWRDLISALKKIRDTDADPKKIAAEACAADFDSIKLHEAYDGETRSLRTELAEAEAQITALRACAEAPACRPHEFDHTVPGAPKCRKCGEPFTGRLWRAEAPAVKDGMDLVDRLLARGDADSVEAVEAIREWRDLYEAAKVAERPKCDSCVHLAAFELSDDLFTCPVVNIRIHRESAAIFGCNQHEGK